MAKQMIQDNTPTNHRQMAALVIKNSVVGPSKNITDQLVQRWLSIPGEQRDFIKKLVNHIEKKS